MKVERMFQWDGVEWILSDFPVQSSHYVSAAELALSISLIRLQHCLGSLTLFRVLLTLVCVNMWLVCCTPQPLYTGLSPYKRRHMKCLRGQVDLELGGDHISCAEIRIQDPANNGVQPGIRLIQEYRGSWGMFLCRPHYSVSMGCSIYSLVLITFAGDTMSPGSRALSPLPLSWEQCDYNIGWT